MKRLFGWGFVIAGGIVALWGAYAVMTGTSRAQLEFGSNLSVSALTGGLVGLAALTVGFVWVRD